MGEPPEILGGARVLAFAVVDHSVTPTGGTTHSVNERVLGPAAGLVIAQYDGDRNYYLFYCSPDWQVMADTCHASCDLAEHQAEFEYRGVTGLWRSRS